MKVVIIGAVAAGTTAAAKLRRNAKEADITVYERDYDISYGICGIPYYIGGEIDELNALVPRGPTWFKDRYSIDIHTRHEVTAVDHARKKLTIINLDTDEKIEDDYDVLVFATGASVLIPDIKGVERKGVFPVRTIENTRDITAYMDAEKPKRAVIVGSGYIGLEMAEQLSRRGLDITVIQRGDQVMSVLDKDITDQIEDHLKKKCVTVTLHETVTEINDTNQSPLTVKMDSGKELDTDLVIMATGIRPNTSLAEKVGVKLGETGAIAVNENMETSVPGIYAIGDVAESFSVLTGKPIYRPLGSTANKMGRIAADAITGGELRHRGILGTSIVRIFDLEVAQTGMTEKEARDAGYDVEVVQIEKPSKPAYMDGKKMTVKAVAAKPDGRLLGVQIVGEEGVDKRIDVFATAIFFGAKVTDLFHLDLAYAPPFSSPKDPVHYTGMVLNSMIGEDS